MVCLRCVLPNGRHLLSASTDETVICWDLSSGLEALRLLGHQGFVTSVVALPDGGRAASAGRDGVIRIWNLGAAQIEQRIVNALQMSHQQIDQKQEMVEQQPGNLRAQLEELKVSVDKQKAERDHMGTNLDIAFAEKAAIMDTLKFDVELLALN